MDLPLDPSKLAPSLVIAIGNPSRGDDALGPMLLDRIEALRLQNVELITDFQLQVEHVLDILCRREVVFVDASVEAIAPFEFKPVEPRADATVTTHELSPAAVLDTCRHLGAAVPDAYVLAIRGYAFDLGTPLSTLAAQNLDAAVDMLSARLAERVIPSPA